MSGMESWMQGRVGGAIRMALVAVAAGALACSLGACAAESVLPEGVKAGTVVTLGAYEQDNNLSNGKEDIDWLVLDVDGGRALLLSSRGLDVQPFNADSEKGNDWETSDLKAWLEGEFASAAFSSAERRAIDGAPFCLSVDEAEWYLSSSGLVCRPTTYAVGQGADPNGVTCRWWLRSPGARSDNAAIVLADGGVSSLGFYVDSVHVAVRPALWVNL